ncbi:unnamed protein product [Ixodes persulcatus]
MASMKPTRQLVPLRAQLAQTLSRVIARAERLQFPRCTAAAIVYKTGCEIFLFFFSVSACAQREREWKKTHTKKKTHFVG